jgi:hypothetical protein
MTSFRSKKQSKSGQILVEYLALSLLLTTMCFGLIWVDRKKWEQLQCHHSIFLEARRQVIERRQSSTVSKTCDGHQVRIELPSAESMRDPSLGKIWTDLFSTAGDLSQFLLESL